MARYSIDDVESRIARFPRVELIHRPTPLRKLERLTAELGGPEIYIKRDDLTGLAFGGNKSRKLEFIIRDALDKGCDTLVTWGSLQSNWCLQTAAAAAKYGIRPVLVLFRSYDIPPGYDGNMLLERILGAEMRIMEPPARGKVVKLEDTVALMNEIAGEERGKGRKPYVVSVGGSMVAGDMDRPLGAVSYVEAFAEMLEQTRALGFVPDAVVHATGSGGTQAGLFVGAEALTDSCRVVGISVSDDKDTFAGYVEDIARAVHRVMDLGPAPNREDIIVFDDYMKDGYGDHEQGGRRCPAPASRDRRHRPGPGLYVQSDDRTHRSHPEGLFQGGGEGRLLPYGRDPGAFPEPGQADRVPGSLSGRLISPCSSDTSGIRCPLKAGARSPFRALSGRFPGSS